MIIFRAIKTKKAFQSSLFREEMKKMAEEIAKEANADFHKTTATWNHQPDFKETVSVGGEGIKTEVVTDDPIYAYVDLGTKKHIIRPKHASALVFNSKFKPKTKPRVIGSTEGFSGPPKIVTQVVHHPGTKARKFTEVIKKKYEPEFKRQAKNAMERFRYRCGHGK